MARVRFVLTVEVRDQFVPEVDAPSLLRKIEEGTEGVIADHIVDFVGLSSASDVEDLLTSLSVEVERVQE